MSAASHHQPVSSAAIVTSATTVWFVRGAGVDDRGVAVRVGDPRSDDGCHRNEDRDAGTGPIVPPVSAPPQKRAPFVLTAGAWPYLLVPFIPLALILECAHAGAVALFAT